MNREKMVTLLLVGFGILGILYYLGKKTTVASPGAGGPATNAGGGSVTAAVRSASAGTQGSIPNIIASAAALTGQTFGSIFARQEQNAGVSIKPGTVDTTMIDAGNALIEPTNPVGFQGTQLVSLDSLVGPTLPGLGSPSPDVASYVSALDVGGTDYGTLYV